VNVQAAQIFGFAEAPPRRPSTLTPQADLSGTHSLAAQDEADPSGTVRHAHAADAVAAVESAVQKIRLEPENVRNGLAQLVLTLVELLRELLERQALRRIDAGSLMPGEGERLGMTFLRLSEEIERLKEYFGFTDEDLNLNLGPLGKLR
jgi:hypothetical protein